VAIKKIRQNPDAFSSARKSSYFAVKTALKTLAKVGKWKLQKWRK